MKIRVRAKGSRFKLALRIPDWCGSYTVKGAETAGTRTMDGYLYVEKDWEEEELIELCFPMEVRLMMANDNVREDIGRVAVTRGPVVYCLEEADNGKDLHLVSVEAASEPVVRDETVCQVPVKTIELSGSRQEKTEGQGLYRPWSAACKKPVRLKFIPYYMWANRGENEMQVWTRAE